ncbi:MAG: RIP metalloprotease RseP [Flavobacteriales bacterium]|jgi:regulator of sigma E protease|nr:RIP metalloprotease RseP [Flavobacteriales bacterium]
MIFAFQLLLSLSILIILHEGGHFIPAKIFKTRVEKFYLFFDPYFSLLKKKIGETEYGIGWLPLGGYVKISGMVDESMDKEQMSQPAQPWEFRSKPAWQRLIIMIGGVVVNVIVGVVIYGVILYTYGKQVVPVENASYGVHCSPIMYQFGFKDGDKILALDGVRPESFSEINKRMMLDDPHEVTIERFGEKHIIKLPDNFGQMMVDSGVKTGAFSLRIPFVIDTVEVGKNAYAAGILKGDSITGVDGYYSPYYQEIAREIRNNKNKLVRLHVVRDGQTIAVPVMVSKEGKIGVGPQSIDHFLDVDTMHYSFAQSIPGGFHEAWETVTDYSSQLRFLFSKSGASQVGGFVTFAKLFPDEWDWWAFWERTAFISLVLAFMNILPIPALDGGHVMFLIWEMITGKAVSQKILERSQIIGMMLLLGLMLYGNGMDIFRLFAGS